MTTAEQLPLFYIEKDTGHMHVHLPGVILAPVDNMDVFEAKAVHNSLAGRGQLILRRTVELEPKEIKTNE